MANGSKTGFELGGVPETLLWNLYYRALEARRPDAVLRNPKAEELVDTIDYPFEERFGVGHPRQAQGQAVSAAAESATARPRALAEAAAESPGGSVDGRRSLVLYSR